MVIFNTLIGTIIFLLGLILGVSWGGSNADRRWELNVDSPSPVKGQKGFKYKVIRYRDYQRIREKEHSKRVRR